MNRDETRTSRTVSVWFRQLGVLCGKEFRQLLRDKAFVIFLFYAFTLSIYAAATGVSLELKNAATIVSMNDQSGLARDLVYRFREPYFHFNGTVENDSDGLHELDRGNAMIMLDIPARFEESIKHGEGADVQMQVDASNATIAFLSTVYANRIVGDLSRDLVARDASGMLRSAQVPFVANRQRVWFNPNKDARRYEGLEQIGKMILLFSMLLPAAAMAREKERGTIEQLLVSPLTPAQIMLSKVLPMTVVIVIASLASVLFVIEGVLGVPLRGHLWLFVAATALFAFTSSGLGLLIASFARNIAQVGLMSLVLMPPLLLLSGAYTPPEMMPAPLKPLMFVSPLFHYDNLMYGILLKGNGPEALWDSALAMTGVGAVIFGLGMWRFRRQFI